MCGLQTLGISGQVLNIDAVGSVLCLQELTLGMVPRAQKLLLVGRLPSLTFLRLILGGRDDISELRLQHLTHLEIVRVRGLSNVDLSAFPHLQNLVIDDQIQIQALDLTRNRQLKRLRFINCKKLRSVTGVSKLAELYELRIARTAVDFQDLLDEGLPASAKVVAFYTGTSKVDRLLRAQLDALGYREFERAPWDTSV